MKFDKEVIRENKKMALGCAVCSAVVVVVFAVFERFDYTVLLGALVGWLLSFGNFFFMSVGVIRALSTGDENAAKIKMHTSYIARTVVMLAVMAVAIIVDFIHWIPVVVSVFYPRIIITAINLVSFAASRKKHLNGEADPESNGSENTENESSDQSTKTAVYEEDDNTEDGFEKFAKTFYKAPVPGEEQNKGSKT